MTIEEFDKTGFTGMMRCLYKGKEYPIYSVDFEERLIAINETNQEVTDDVKLTFWIPNEPIKVFNTTYENLIKIIESADKNLYDTIP